MITQNTETFAEITTPVNPFPGLRPFEFDESHLFFGRDGQSEQLIAKLAHTRFLAVVGTSGSGKSSLVRAGLLPTLLGGFMTSAGSDWRIAIMRPGNDPIGNLAQALNAPDVFGSEIAENAAIQTAVTEATLRRGALGLVDAVRQSLMPHNESLLVVVDQFEEIFRFARVSQGKEYQNEAAAFVKLIPRSLAPARASDLRRIDDAFGLSGRLLAVLGFARSHQRQPVPDPAPDPRSIARSDHRSRGRWRRPDHAAPGQPPAQRCRRQPGSTADPAARADARLG